MEWFNTFNDIEDNLAEISGRQKFISGAMSEEPNDQDVRDRMRTEIAIESERAELITLHPEGTCSMKRSGKVVTSLEITNPEEFWKTARICVIETI